MTLVDQWRATEESLPEGWGSARLRLIVSDRSKAERAAALLGPANPGRYGSFVSFEVARRGGGPSPNLVRRLLARLDAEGFAGTIDAVRIEEEASATAAPERSLARQWQGLVGGLPDDWSDAYAEVELVSTDYLERGALLLAPLNPSRVPDRTAFRFRAARRFGYGASSMMTHRCFERLDSESIRGTLRILWALSDTKPVYTQGPVWYSGGGPV
ncbi:MAG TPA: hypothetical protein VLZ04_06685 [Gaiellaceae bacterium]|nr:hypothetical protein [Gaiellaceae bacterium]